MTFDVVNKCLVPWLGSVPSLPDFRQGVETVELRLVKPNPQSISGSSNPAYTQYTPADLSAYLGPMLGIWSKSTGALNDSSQYLLAITPTTGWTYNQSNADDPYFTGTFDTYTTELAAAIGKGREIQAFFAAALVRTDTSIEPVFDHEGEPNCTVRSLTPDNSGVLPVSAIPGFRAIDLPIYWRKNGQIYVTDLDEATNQLVTSLYTP